MPDTISHHQWAPPVAAARPASEGKRLRNWILCWLIIPNFAFVPISLMGGPPRYADILIGAIVGLLVRRMNYGVRLAAFGATLSYLVIAFIARMFNMSIGMILSVVGLVVDIQPAVSPEYVAGVGLLLLSAGLGAWWLRRPADFRTSKFMLGAVAATLALAGADHALSVEAMGSYSRTAPADAPFSSAAKQADLLTLADGKTNLLVVVVEAMGEPSDPRLKARLDSIWQRPELASRYTVQRGRTPFYGSTTSAELRELCGRWGDYQAIDRPDPTCLPAILAKRGYRTSAYHAFTGSFFDRTRWYPLIGFQQVVFGEQMLNRGASFCPNVFPGACDRDVPAMIGRQLADGDWPQFIYWLTLNSHLPIVANRQLGTEQCATSADRLDADYPMICRLFAIWANTAEALVEVVHRPDFPPTDILIVGDHMPPFTHQKSRLKFDPAHVPWVLLRHRRDTRP